MLIYQFYRCSPISSINTKKHASRMLRWRFFPFLWATVPWESIGMTFWPNRKLGACHDPPPDLPYGFQFGQEAIPILVHRTGGFPDLHAVGSIRKKSLWWAFPLLEGSIGAFRRVLPPKLSINTIINIGLFVVFHILWWGGNYMTNIEERARQIFWRVKRLP